MCPICNFGEDGTMKKELSDFFIWLADNYGDNDNVLQSFSENMGTYGYCGDGSMVGYFERRRDMFKPLFTHKITNVAKWARRMYESEEYNVKYETINDEYKDMVVK